MRIRRLKLGGFKSFVESAELRIEPGLTGVVGPNGCGKSNLLEAIRWVMGEGSPKNLRGGGMEDVIFAGTATRPPRDFAEVSLLIEREPAGGGDDAGGESEVTRRIERSAGSAYRIDGRDVRQKDVSLLFADAATGAHSPALVSQGRIGSVIAAKPVERRLMLEEAAGISGLHARRKDAEQKLRATEANLARLNELLGDQETRVAALKRQARAAERYRQLTEKIRAAEARLLYARWREADEAAKAASEEASRAAEAVGALQQAMQQARQVQEQAATELAARRSALADARDRGRTLAHELATARARRDTIVRRLDELDKLQDSLGVETAREESLRQDAAKAIEALNGERTGIESRLADGEAQAARVAADLTAAEAASRQAEAELAALLAREAAMRAERRVAEAALDSARSQVERTEAEAGRLDRQANELGDGSEHLAARTQAEASAKAAAAALASAETSLAAAEDGRSQAAEQRDTSESSLAAARAALAAAAAEREALAKALAQDGGEALAEVRAEPGYERALAAALGDDLEATIGGNGPRRWAGSAVDTGDPPLAPGLAPLADFASTPPELARRMAQVGVAEDDNGQPLAIGQRLVTRDGRMRRWDGFVAEAGGAAAAERLIRANRLAEIVSSLPQLEDAVAEAAAARDQAASDVERFRRDAEDARAAAAAAERLGREAGRAGDTAAGAVERIEAQRTALAERRGDLEPLLAASRDAVIAAQAALDSLTDPDQLAGQIADARAAAGAAGQAVADLRAAAATRAREMAADRERDAAAQREQGEWRTRTKEAEARLLETARRADELATEREDLSGEPVRLADEVTRLEAENQASDAWVAESAVAESVAEAAGEAAARTLAEVNESTAVSREARAGAVARAEAQEARRTELAKDCGEQFECPPTLLPERLGFEAGALADADTEKAGLERMSAERERLGPVNLVAESELAEIEQNRLAGAAECEELQEAINRLRGSIGSLNREGRVRLLEAYSQVDKHFRSLFTTLFDGGQAHLELVESDDPLEAGLEIMAQPPGKRLSALSLLSGGEQALTAIALIFALFLTNPAPICVLDEVDAPLDDANVERFCDLLDRMTCETDTRYLIVTHNAVTMSRMHRLYGVTMVEKGVSRLVSVDLGGAETLLAAE